MRMFWQKADSKADIQAQKTDGSTSVNFEPSVLRQNNITRLSIDERWTKLFVTIKISPDLDKAEKEMGELIKNEAMLKNEQENLEPQKRKIMNEIMNLTQEAFENDNGAAKKKLAECKKEIEKINTRINDVLGNIEEFDEKLKAANLELLEDSITYIFSTLKINMGRASDIRNELQTLEQREKALREELETISVDWTKYALDLTELIGSDEVKRLESGFGLEEYKNETVDTSTDEGN